MNACWSFLLVLVVIFNGVLDCHAKKLTSDGYEVELLWKVKGKQLRMWGDIEKGQACKKLHVTARLGNDRYDQPITAYLNTYVKREHSPTSRSVFKGQDYIGDNRYKKGWRVQSCSVVCSER